MMRHTVHGYFFCLLALAFYLFSCDKLQKDEPDNKFMAYSPLALEKKIAGFNNNFQYDSSLLLLREIRNNAPDSVKYHTFLLQSYTYKRLSNYNEVIICLDSALRYGLRSKNPDYYSANILCQKAFAYFDIQNYDVSDSLMKQLTPSQMKFLTGSDQAILLAQQSFNAMQDKKFDRSDSLLSLAEVVLRYSDPCNLPVVYGKQILLFGEIGDESRMYSVYNKAVKLSDSCSILKYRIHLADVMYLGFVKMRDFENGMKFKLICDSLHNAYNEDDYDLKLKIIESDYHQSQTEELRQSNSNKLKADQRLIALLVSLLIVLILLFIAFALWRKHRKEMREKLLHHQFTAQLFSKTEEERKRIAADLHDDISHELLQLKEITDKEERKIVIHRLIEEVRNISRNLHPVMFEKVGLVLTLEQLCTRIQNTHDFMVNLDFDYRSCFTTEIELHIYRIIQEALNNTLKHADAHAALIKLYQYPSFVMLEITDNGKGFSVSDRYAHSASFGLHNISERAKAIGGKVQFQSDKSGTKITIQIPY
jgi:two-component sensor histidine kinase